MTQTHRYTLPELSCEHCVATVTRHLQQQFPSGQFKVDLAHKELVTKVSGVESDEILSELESIGYPGQPLPRAENDT